MLSSLASLRCHQWLVSVFEAMCSACKSVGYFWKTLQNETLLLCSRGLGLVETQADYVEGVRSY